MEGSSQGEIRCLEAPQGTNGQDLCLHGAGEAPISWEQHLSPSSLSSGNPEVLAEKVGTPGLQGRLNGHVKLQIICSSQPATQQC